MTLPAQQHVGDGNDAKPINDGRCCGEWPT
jgi:hypothetical protein